MIYYYQYAEGVGSHSHLLSASASPTETRKPPTPLQAAPGHAKQGIDNIWLGVLTDGAAMDMIWLRVVRRRARAPCRGDPAADAAESSHGDVACIEIKSLLRDEKRLITAHLVYL
jgi:hypothetical protein